MGMDRRKRKIQNEFWISPKEFPEAPGHPFFDKLNKLLDEHGFDDYVESLCEKYYVKGKGRPSIPPGVYFRMLLIGYFMGIESERAIAWQCRDSRSLAKFLGYKITEQTPDHSSLSRIRQRYDLETHNEVFGWILCVLSKHNLINGQSIGVDSTTLEANASMRNIVRRDNGENYADFMIELAKESGIETPTREDCSRIDRKREKKKEKKLSNKEWQSATDSDAKITKMKDSSTHMGYKASHAVDLTTGAILGIAIHGGCVDDRATIWDIVKSTCSNLRLLYCRGNDVGMFEELVADKGYHSNNVMVDLTYGDIRSYISEPKRSNRKWEGKEAEKKAVYANRRRIRGYRGKLLLRLRSELVERTFAHCYETGAMRRIHLREIENILKRLLIHTAAYNLSLVMRKLFGAGTPRALANLSNAAKSSICYFYGIIYYAFYDHSRKLQYKPYISDITKKYCA